MRTNVKFLLLIISVGFINLSCSDNSVAGDIPDKILNTGTNENTTDSTSESTKATAVGTVIFEDNFDQTDGLPDKTKWVLCPNTGGWGRYMSVSYDQAYVKDGLLVVKGEKVNGLYKAGGIWSKGLVSFTYGRVEVRARIKSAQGGWPAIWMIPEPKTKYPTDGEMDLMEQVSSQTNAWQTIHSYYLNDLGHAEQIRQISKPYKVNEFNTYAVEWTPEKVVFYINGSVTFSYPNLHLTNDDTVRQWPFNKPYFLVLNYALGGVNTWPGVIDDSQLPGYMEVDWVKVTKIS